jgi:hypothetical protein
VTTITPFRSDGVTASGTQGVIVGLNNGSVQAWTGNITGTKAGNPWGQNDWIQLHGTDWKSPVKAVAPAVGSAINEVGNAVTRDGVIIGLGNGSVQQWSGLISGKTGQGDWTELEAMKNDGALAAFRAADPVEAFTCSDLRCSSPGMLLDAVSFAKNLASGGSKPKFGEPGGVGSAGDPIFSDPLLKSAAKDGTYYPIAFYKKFTAKSDSTPEPVKFTGSVEIKNGEDNCGAGTARCSVLKIPLSSRGVDIKPDSLLETGTLLGIGDDRIQPATRIVKELFIGTGYERYFLLSGLPQIVQSSAMKATQTPSLKVGLDVNPVIYGYMYVPDGFFPKFKAGNYSVGALVAAEVGPSVTVNLGAGGSVYAPSKTLASYQEIIPVGAVFLDTLQLNAGVKVSGSVTLNGLDNKSSVSAYAYVVPGMLLTYNTVGAPNEIQGAFNAAFDVNANALKDISGISVTGTVTPYVNLLYGIVVPENVPLVGGWSVFSVSAGLENPISATVCADRKSLCPAVGSGSGVANFYGVINDGTFTTSGLFEGFLEKTYASARAGKVLTVTQSALFNPTKLAVGQLVKGPGVTAGTTITKYLGSSVNGDQYEVSTSQKTVGGGSSGTHPSLTAYLPGAPVSLTLGTQGLLTFHAGVVEALTSKLSYDAKVPLYELNTVIVPGPPASKV